MNYLDDFYKTIFETAGTGIVVIEKDTTISLANQKFANLIGYSKQEIENKKSWTEFTHPDDLEFVKKQHYLRREDPEKAKKEYEFRILDKNNKIHHVLININIIPNSDQSVASLLEITEFKQTKNLFQNTLEIIPDMISIHDTKYNILYSNWKGFANVPEKERIIGEKCYNVYRGTNDVCSDCKTKHVLKTKEPIAVDHNINDKWYYVKAIPILDKDNNVEFIVEWVSDITDRKKTEENLIEAKKEAENASLAKSEFLANMSHEIRTPLNGIKGMLQLLEMQELSKEEQQEYINLGIQSTDRLTKLLSDILDLSKIEVDKMEIRFEKVCAQKLCDSVKELFSFTSYEKNISINFEIDESISKPFISDETRIQQILFNLVGNAFKFTHEGQIDVFVKKLNNNFNKDWVLITVSDTGIGMSEDELDKLFEPFAQSENIYTRQYQGAGLGLTIVGKIVKMLDGSICAESEKNIETTFYVSFPVKKYQSTRKKEYELEKQKIKGLRILVAEDELSNQFVIKKQLETLGHEVVMVENGQQAVNMVDVQKFDCIIMDIRMPIMDGVEATKKIKEKIDIVIIALTAHAMKGDKEKFLEEGMDDYLSKPLNHDDLVNVLSKFFGK